MADEMCQPSVKNQHIMIHTSIEAKAGGRWRFGMASSTGVSSDLNRSLTIYWIARGVHFYDRGFVLLALMAEWDSPARMTKSVASTLSTETFRCDSGRLSKHIILASLSTRTAFSFPCSGACAEEVFFFKDQGLRIELFSPSFMSNGKTLVTILCVSNIANRKQNTEET